MLNTRPIFSGLLTELAHPDTPNPRINTLAMIACLMLELPMYHVVSQFVSGAVTK